MRFNNVAPGAVLVAFALAVIAYATTFPRLHGQDYGPDLFPTLIAAGLLICGIILIMQGLRARATTPLMELGDWAQDSRNILNVGLLLGGIVFYILVSDDLGFIPSSIIILTTLFIRFGSGWRSSLALALATTLIIHTLFAKVLLVPLPWGILLPVAW